MVEIVNAVSSGVRRPIQFFHLPVPKPRTDDAIFAPLAEVAPGNRASSRSRSPRRHGRQRRWLRAARRHVRVGGVARRIR
jgi:hypothetical protein